MATFEDVAKQFDALSERIESTWPAYVPEKQTFITRIGWNSIALTPSDASEMAREIAHRIRGIAKDNIAADAGAPLVTLGKQAEEIEFGNFGSGPSDVARSTYEFLMWVALKLPTRPADVDWDKIKSEAYVPKTLAARIKALDSRLSGLEPRSETIEKKIDAIEAAHDAAERLPTDMEELRSSKEELANILTVANRHAAAIANDFEAVERATKEIDDLNKQADGLVKRCEEAYRITTSAGLAGAFDSRSRSLTITGWFWLATLIVALIVAVYLGSARLTSFMDLLNGDSRPSMIFLNVLVAVVGIGGPVWLAWLATMNRAGFAGGSNS